MTVAVSCTMAQVSTRTGPMSGSLKGEESDKLDGATGLVGFAGDDQ